MQLLSDSYGLTVLHDAANRCLFLIWQGKHNGREKKACCLLILQQIHLTASHKLLVDSSQDLDGWTEAVQWLGHEYYDDLIAAGIEAIAWVLPHNLKARTDVDTLLLTARPTSPTSGVPMVDSFHDLESAYFWLHHIAVVR